jgi:membrane-anchored protein YejM (alkaline phosphatase superfamily)
MKTSNLPESSSPESAIAVGVKKKPSLFLKGSWWQMKGRLELFRWSAGFFSITAVLMLLIGLLYITTYRFPGDFLSIAYTLTAFISHFASFSIIAWIALVFPLIIFLPYRKFIIPACVALTSIVLCVELLDAQVYTSNRFHFNLLTVKILGWKTWGFGILYLFIFTVFNSFVAKICWNRFVIDRKKIWLSVSLPVTLVFLLFTHFTHMWADATGYVDITRFTTTLPLFYPSTSKRFMVKHGLVDISNRRVLPKKLTSSGSVFAYPQKPLEFAVENPDKNILLIAVDGMRYDMMNPVNAPRCFDFASRNGTIFRNHYSGGNSTKMGTFSIFYGIPPTYQQFVESNKCSPLFIDRLLQTNYSIGIFTSYKLYAPANLDITAFVKIENLRLETVIPDPQAAYRNDSAITDQWKEWLDHRNTDRPFFGFLFYDALCTENYPPAYKDKIQYDKGMTEAQKKFARYKVSLQYSDSLVESILEDLTRRGLLESTVVIITSDHGEEFDDNGLGYNGHGSSFSDWQIRTPFVTIWPGKPKGIVERRTSHYDIVATLMKDVFMVKNPESDYCSGKNLFSEESWEWILTGSYFNFAIVEPSQITVQFPGGYYEVRDKQYQIVKKPQIGPNIVSALGEVGRFFKQ